MNTHCNVGDKPIVKYRFQGDIKDRIFKTQYAPIDVDAKESPVNTDQSKYNNQGFKITYKITDGDKIRSALVLAYTIGWNPEFSGYWGLRTIDCDRPTLPMQTSGGTAIYPNSIAVDTSVKCPVAANKRCSIEVSYNGLVIYQDQGNCPVTYSVQCGKCPDGQHECESNIYPYYCCNSCADTASKIKNLASKIGK